MAEDIPVGYDSLEPTVEQAREFHEGLGSGKIRGFLTVKVIRADGTVEIICEDKDNLLTNGGRDFVHNQVYTNTSAGTRGCGFIGVSADAGAPSAGDTTLTGEISSGGMTRVDATTKTHTNGTNTTTIQHTFTATALQTALVKAALFNAVSSGTMVHENTFTSVTLQINDTLQLTWTITAG
jgi:hypothetical protein